jgi:tRNA(adenine34) deaminase
MKKNGHLKVTGSNFPFHPKSLTSKGVMSDECAALMKSFFKGKR